jgi:uncharacterized delta-60 repeat protein
MKTRIIPTRLVLAVVLWAVLPGLRPAQPALSSALPAPADLTPGALDTGFDPGTGANDYVYAVAVQPDGKVLIGGNFTQVNGVGRIRIARLNGDGSLDAGFDPGLGADGTVSAIAVQLDGKVLIGGNFTQVNGVGRNHIARLNANGSFDAGFDPGTGPNGWVFAVALQPDGKVLIGGFFGHVNNVERGCVARLNNNGSLDTGFDTTTGADNSVRAVAFQPDGKVLIGGDFTTVNGVGRNRIARLNANGSLDTGFNPGTGVLGAVEAVALQLDGKVLIGGQFTQFNEVGRNNIARLNANGSLDTGFNPGTGADSTVLTVALQTNGQVLIGGNFTHVNGVDRNFIARLNANGTLDSGFDPGTGANDQVEALAVQPDGHALIGGLFTTVNGVGRNRIARLNADGTLDTGFDTSIGANNTVYAVALEPRRQDGKVLIGGDFTTVNEVGRNRIARLNANGSLDTGFDPGTGADGTVYTIAVQLDGKVLIGGNFTTINGVGRNRAARLNTDGSLDASFDPGTGATFAVRALVIQPDGKVLIGGQFTQVNGVDRNHIARLNSNGSLDAGFDPGTGANGWVYGVALQSNGKVLIGGNFTQVNGVGRYCVARLNANGALDTGFDPGTGANGAVYTVALQSDGKVLIGGSFTTFYEVGRSRLARLNTDGALDTGFLPTVGMGANASVESVAVQADGKVLLGGLFTQVNVVVRNRIARLLGAVGVLDTGFDPGTGANDYVYAVAVQPDGMVLIGGSFTKVNGQTRNRFARLNGATSPAFTSATPADGRVGMAYTHTFTASGFPLPTFYVTSGSLPPGLTLIAFSGLLVGAPTAVGTYHFTVTASNYEAPSATQNVTLVIDQTKVYLPLTLHQ